MSTRNQLDNPDKTDRKKEIRPLTAADDATDRLREKPPAKPQDQPKSTPDKPAEKPADKPVETKPEPFKQASMTKRSGNELSDDEKKDGVAYSLDAQYRGGTRTGKHGFNQNGQFVRYDDEQQHIYRNLNKEDLKNLRMAGQKEGWYLMGEKGPQKLANNDVHFFPTDKDGGIFISRFSKDIVYAWDKNGVKHQGTINTEGAFVEHDGHGNPIWVVRPDGSQLKDIEYALAEQGRGYNHNTPLKSFTEVSKNGEQQKFVRDELNRNRYLRADGTSEQRFNACLDKSSTFFWDDKDGVSTITMGDSTVVHGNISFGDANKAIDYRHARNAAPETSNLHLHPTTPTFFVDNQGRTTAVLAPEKGGKPGCNDSAAGGVDRFFRYMGDTNKFRKVGEINSKGDFADRLYLTTLNVDGSYTVQHPVMKEFRVWEGNPNNGRRPRNEDEESENDKQPVVKTEKRPAYETFVYRGPLDFVPGTRDVEWHEPIGPQGKQFEATCINHPDGSVEYTHRRDSRGNNGEIISSIDRYFDAKANLLGVQKVDANGSRGEKITHATHPNASFDLSGKVTFTDKDQNQHNIFPDGTETILNPTSWTYVQKDNLGRPIFSGQLDATGNTDKNNSLHFTYKDDDTVKVDSFIDGQRQTIFDGPGFVSPEGDFRHQATLDGQEMIVVEQPDLSTRYKKPGKDGAIVQVIASDAAFDVIREMTEGQDPTQPNLIVDTLTDKSTGDVYHRELVAVDPDKAYDNGLDPHIAVRQYFMTLKKVSPGQDPEKAPYLVPPPPKPGETAKPGIPRLFTDLEVLRNGYVQATDLRTT